MKNKITFVSLIPGVADAVPVYEAKHIDHQWIKTARQDYKNRKQQDGPFNHIMQCPGIFDLYNYGYIVPMWHDCLIETIGDKTTYKWAIPHDEGLTIDGIKAPLGSHEPDIVKNLPSPHYSLDGVIKFNTPWRIIAPKGIKLLMLPIAYPDSFEFESTIGLLDPGISNEINVQVKWNVLNARHQMKLGTPLCHIIPLTDKKLDLEVRDANEQDFKWEKKKQYFASMSWVPKRNILKQIWENHFKL
jgi:hypothetical protein